MPYLNPYPSTRQRPKFVDDIKDLRHEKMLSSYVWPNAKIISVCRSGSMERGAQLNRLERGRPVGNKKEHRQIFSPVSVDCTAVRAQVGVPYYLGIWLLLCSNITFCALFFNPRRTNADGCQCRQWSRG